jgi:hypothetical protein
MTEYKKGGKKNFRNLTKTMNRQRGEQHERAEKERAREARTLGEG